ncbi:MAG: (4Fe-4S)-binding protein [Candidatus Melainabacteria bacterium GWF2_32_7]|nr:MAG: (4Fe-4S)-binding protein [Candidatus Melainabacteria bacterium GWF2_32_7]
MRIAVASGKGGTGKSTVSINLAWILSKQYKNVYLLDCDVEEPNCHIFLKPELQEVKKVFLPVPEINSDLCIGCGKCSNLCEFNALACIKDKIIVFPELCHGCGGCMLVCPVKAIREAGREVGVIEEGKIDNLNFIHGKLRIGEAMSPPLIKEVKRCLNNSQIQILDCPPGTSCPVISAISDTDFVILVTEPTPFGLYDLKLAVDMVKEMGLPFGIVINKSGSNDYLIEEYANIEQIEIMAKIPDDRLIAEAYSRGEIIIETLPEYKELFFPLLTLFKKEVSR